MSFDSCLSSCSILSTLSFRDRSRIPFRILCCIIKCIISFDLMGVDFQPTHILFTVVTFLIFYLLVYPNSINFTLTLLIASLLLLSSLVSSSLLPTLRLFLVFLIYIGAIIVLIAYICAITPNLLLSSIVSPSLLTLSLPAALALLSGPLSSPLLSPNQLPLTDFFYGPFGVSLLLFIILFLFLVLLIVTTQHSNPKGPFRSFSL